MTKWGTLFAAIGGAFIGAAATAKGLEEPLVVPSGYDVYLHEMLFENRQDHSRVARFRYVMPIIGQEGITFENVEGDFVHLCEVQALPVLVSQDQQVGQIIVSLSDRETEFGVISSVATQFFEAFSVQDGSCIWEGF